MCNVVINWFFYNIIIHDVGTGKCGFIECLHISLMFCVLAPFSGVSLLVCGGPSEDKTTHSQLPPHCRHTNAWSIIGYLHIASNGFLLPWSCSWISPEEIAGFVLFFLLLFSTLSVFFHYLSSLSSHLSLPLSSPLSLLSFLSLPLSSPFLLHPLSPSPLPPIYTPISWEGMDAVETAQAMNFIFLPPKTTTICIFIQHRNVCVFMVHHSLNGIV